jgi:type IV pilus assembly protein PilX
MATRPFASIATSSTTLAKPGKTFWTLSGDHGTSEPSRPGSDAAGNTVRYVIHRLCETTGAPHTRQLRQINPPRSTAAAVSAPAASSQLTNNQVYYRITTRITGPRNTVAYIQTIVAL